MAAGGAVRARDLVDTTLLGSSLVHGKVGIEQGYPFPEERASTPAEFC
jgi:hypothetical protein